MSAQKIDSLHAAVMHAIRGARYCGTWDCEWWDYAPPEWRNAVRRAPREIVAEAVACMNDPPHDSVAEFAVFVEHLMDDDPLFSLTLIQSYSREDMPLCYAEMFAHFENELRDAA